ncbi:hypothetical protein MNBD_GAMMA23-1647 [hydrothermal vent metagenome]|uniref:Uncharacterized protein n=1 Tax=hydrothermal vent metagenome TaxID=652676 RepID=A0A3B1A7P5_9ZZZZ
MVFSRSIKYVLMAASGVFLAGCLGSMPRPGVSYGNVVAANNTAAEVRRARARKEQHSDSHADRSNHHSDSHATRSTRHSESRPPVAVSSNRHVNVTKSRSTQVTVDAYDAAALNDYYGALKQAVKSLSQFANMGPGQIKAMGQYNNTGINLWTLLWSSNFSGEFETSKIELESWPLDARKKGWKILGRKIKKYNKLFYKHRRSILASKDVTKDVRRKLNDIELVTAKSLFAE